MKRFATLLLAFALILGALSGCSNTGTDDSGDSTSVVSEIDNPNKVNKLENADDVVMTYEDRTLTSGMYAFIFSYLKTVYLFNLQYYGSSDYVEDTKAFWSTLAGETTYGKAVTKDINDHCMMLLICDKMASEYSVSLSSEDLALAEEELNDLVADYGSVSKFNDYLSRFGVDYDDVSDYLNKKYMISAVQSKLCSAGGICEVSDQEVKDAIAERYCKVKHIYLSNKTYNGDASAKAEEVIGALNGGASFKDYVSLSEDTAAKTHPDGMLVNIAETNEKYAEVAASLKEGEYGICKFDEGIYILMGVKMTKDDIEGEYESVFSSIANERFVEYMKDRYGFVELNKDKLDKFDIVTAETIGF